MVIDPIRCPYCVMGDDFKPMRYIDNDLYFCDKCGHMVRAGNITFECTCDRCRTMRLK
jgi:hypothetical protein